MVQAAILVLNWNGLENTQACLESCPPGTRRYVLNNGCRPDQRYVSSIDDSVVFDTPRNVGFAAGMNVLIGQALQDGAEWLLLLNNDARLAKNALSCMLRTATEATNDVAAICPAILDAGSGRVWSVGGHVDLRFGRTTSPFHGANPAELPTASREVDYGSGACLLLSTTALEAIGGFDETYFAYWEETDWCWRARASGFRILTCPRALVMHEGGASTHLSLQIHLLVRNAILFMRRHAEAWHWISFVPAMALWSIPMWSARGLVANPMRVARSIMLAIAWHAGRVPDPQTAYATALQRHDARRSDRDS